MLSDMSDLTFIKHSHRFGPHWHVWYREYSQSSVWCVMDCSNFCFRNMLRYIGGTF